MKSSLAFVLILLSCATLCSALRSDVRSSGNLDVEILEGCTDWCHHLTSGPCQHPDLNNEVCSPLMNNNGTSYCPIGMTECGPRPTRPEPSPAPSKSNTASSSVSAVPSRTASNTATATPSSSSSATPSSTVTATPSSSSSATPSSTRSTYPSTTPSTTPTHSGSGAIVSAPDGRLVQNTWIGEVDMPQDNYRISFDMTIHNTVGNWANIFHFTATRGNIGSENRVPALWLYPGDRKFHWICGTAASTNQEVSSSYLFNLNQNYHIDLEVRNGVATIRVDGASTNGNGQNLGTLWGTRRAQFYMADPWYEAAAATITGFVVADL